MSDVKKKPRKISCLPCRTKKAKCEGQTPHCSRCIRNSREHLCIYPKPRTYGRPPKNAVFLKNQDLVVSSTTTQATPKQTKEKDSIQCREFIFENQSGFYPAKTSSLSEQQQQQAQQQQPSTTPLSATEILARNYCQVPQRFMRFINQILDIERIFSLYLTRGYHLRESLKGYQLSPRFKLRSLHQHFTWLSTSLVNLTVKRTCQLFNIDSFVDPELTITAFMREEKVNIFFFNTNNQYNLSSPLRSIPTEQAMQLINYFFQLHPYHILLNKTKLLQDYWNDSVEPLLLCAIYGISIYTCQQIVKGGSYKLWDMQRNPFLNYAYVLMERFFKQRNLRGIKSPSSLGNYQAAVILGIFETMFGLPKHGMTIISLSYMMAADLGIFSRDVNVTDGLIDRDHVMHESGQQNIEDYDPIDKEQLITTYWAALRSTAYGYDLHHDCSVGLYLRDSLLYHGQPFPPANKETSASYQYDLAHNNQSSSSAHLIEAFHTEMVITYFSSKLFACLPKSEYNVFGCKTYPAPAPTTIEKQHIHDHQMLLQLLGTAAASTAWFNSETDCKVQLVLNDFSSFIAQESYQWSFQQRYTIETTYYLYCIHFSFIKPGNFEAPMRYQHSVKPLDLTNLRIAARITNLSPTTTMLLTLLQTFLQESDDKKLYSEADLGNDNNDETSFVKLLPFGIMSLALETLVDMTIVQYQLGIFPDKIHDQIRAVHTIAKHVLFWVPQQQASTKIIYKKLKDFLRLNQISMTKNTFSNDDIMSNAATTTNISPAAINSTISVTQPTPPSSLCSAITTTAITDFGAGNLSFLFLDENQMFASEGSSVDSVASASGDSTSNGFLHDFDSLFQSAFDGIC
ncbi:hypothetical protein MAM1_0334d09788 [Mucor ambiguus]|uniref:Zn(2)-C6 fungal-type domain-containing protein n=1 Tax=Mucor ambiguus TaxID=91626 RepID=A0A0C9LXN5_9FUNG|nr:hypothetical protein MAM1_0334d09788 [Mucor ambiguus]